MHKKEELLTIGEMAKLTGTGIRALHYYERKNILKPAYVDPDTGYRYYSYEQVNYADMISSCVDLGIPLKDLAYLANNEDYLLLHDFFVHNSKVAEEKIKAARVMSALADKALSKMEHNRKYELGRLYKSEFAEKIYYTQPCGQSLSGINRTRTIYEFIHKARAELSLSGLDEKMVLMEYGYLHDCSPDGGRYYAFLELPKAFPDENILTISPGAYHFIQDKDSNINEAPQIFEELLMDNDYYMAVEVESLMSGKSKIHEPIYELRFVSTSDW